MTISIFRFFQVKAEEKTKAPEAKGLPSLEVKKKNKA
jgi:hypothetical protein